MISTEFFSTRRISDDNQVMVQYKKYVKFRMITGCDFLDFDEWLDCYFGKYAQEHCNYETD